MWLFPQYIRKQGRSGRLKSLMRRISSALFWGLKFPNVSARPKVQICQALLCSKILRAYPLTRKKNPNTSPWPSRPSATSTKLLLQVMSPRNTILHLLDTFPHTIPSPFFEHTWRAATSSILSQGLLGAKRRYPSGPVQVKFSDTFNKKKASSHLYSTKAWFLSLVSISGCLLYLFL